MFNDGGSLCDGCGDIACPKCEKQYFGRLKDFCISCMEQKIAKQATEHKQKYLKKFPWLSKLKNSKPRKLR